MAGGELDFVLSVKRADGDLAVTAIGCRVDDLPVMLVSLLRSFVRPLRHSGDQSLARLLSDIADVIARNRGMVDASTLSEELHEPRLSSGAPKAPKDYN